MKAKEAIVTYRRTETELPSHALRDSADVAKALRELIPDGPQERFVALALDGRNRITSWSTIAMGDATSCAVDAGIAFRWAILAGATRVIFSHNHPSGDCTPSRDDDEMTARLVKAGELLGVAVLDHVVLGDYETYYSYCDSGKLGAS